MKFQVGDIVEVVSISDNSCSPAGIATIIQAEVDCYGVVFTKVKKYGDVDPKVWRGHTLNGLLPREYPFGWWCKPERLRSIFPKRSQS